MLRTRQFGSLLSRRPECRVPGWRSEERRRRASNQVTAVSATQHLPSITTHHFQCGHTLGHRAGIVKQGLLHGPWSCRVRPVLGVSQSTTERCRAPSAVQCSAVRCVVRLGAVAVAIAVAVALRFVALPFASSQTLGPPSFLPVVSRIWRA
jgi:hypothetical protein